MEHMEGMMEGTTMEEIQEITAMMAMEGEMLEDVMLAGTEVEDVGVADAMVEAEDVAVVGDVAEEVEIDFGVCSVSFDTILKTVYLVVF